MKLTLNQLKMIGRVVSLERMRIGHEYDRTLTLHNDFAPHFQVQTATMKSMAETIIALGDIEDTLIWMIEDVTECPEPPSVVEEDTPKRKRKK